MVIFRFRSPALITTKAVITLVMLAIGRSVFRPRLHSSLPVAAFSTAADLAPTPLGPSGAGAALAAGMVSAVPAATTAPASSPVRRTVRRARATVDTPAE